MIPLKPSLARSLLLLAGLSFAATSRRSDEDEPEPDDLYRGARGFDADGPFSVLEPIDSGLSPNPFLPPELGGTMGQDPVVLGISPEPQETEFSRAFGADRAGPLLACPIYGHGDREPRANLRRYDGPRVEHVEAKGKSKPTRRERREGRR